MHYSTISLECFSVRGKKIRTTNAENKFGEMWEDFFKTYSGGQPVAVYTDYESDARGMFSFIVGVKTNSTEETTSFSGGNYMHFHLNDRSTVLECWHYIWSSDLNRAYTADFEFYNEDGSVDMYIAQKAVIESRCGLVCSECTYKEPVGCKGCLKISKPFWGESCAVKSCCEGKGKENCGFCDSFACDTLNGFAYDKKQGDNGKRIEHCREFAGAKGKKGYHKSREPKVRQ